MGMPFIHMKTYPEKYTEQEFEGIPSIQRKMKDIRKKITAMGGTRPKSTWEDWIPAS